MVLLVLAATLSLASETFEGQGFYFGDPHVHTGASGDGGSEDVGDCDGECGSVEDLVELALDEGLDWLSVTDHVNARWTSTEADFAEVLEVQLDAYAAGDLVTIPGAEVHLDLTAGGQLGHRNLMFFGDNDDLDELTVAGLQFNGTSTRVDTCAELFSWVEDLQDTFGPTLLIPHHPAASAPMPVDWTCHHPGFEPAVELYSEHGNSMGDDTGFDPIWSKPLASGMVHYALELGHHLGFMAGSDRHDTHPGAACSVDTEHEQHPYGAGITVAVVPEDEVFDRDALYSAMLDKRTYATSGPLLPALVSYSSAGAPLGTLGEKLVFPLGQPLTVDVSVPTEHSGHVVEVVAVTPDGAVPMFPASLSTWSVTLAPPPDWVYVRIEIDGSTWYAQGCDDGGDDQRDMVWMSPSWTSAGPGDLDRDGMTWAGGDCDDGDPTVNTEAEEQCQSDHDHDCDGLAGTEDPDCYSLDQPDGPSVQGNLEEEGWEGRIEPAAGPDAPSHPLQYPGVGCATSWPGGLAFLPLVPLFVRRRRSRS